MSKYNRVRLDPEERKRLILNAALDDAIERGPYNISVISVSRRLTDCSKSTIKHYYPTLSALRDAVIIEAISDNRHFIIGAAVAMKNPLIDSLSEEKQNHCLNIYRNQD